MPLAPAHPAAVLPLRRLRLPLSALVVGAVAPDVPVYLPVGVGYATTHSFRGVVVVTVIGLVLLWVWSVLVRDALVDVTSYLRHRCAPHVRLDRRAWLLAPIAVAAGAATHVLWDSTTHDWGFVVQGVGFLDDELGPLPVYRWLQHASTVGGTLVVAGYGLRELRRRPVVRRPGLARLPVVWWAALGGTAVVASFVRRDPEAVAGVLLVALVVLALVWRATASCFPTVAKPE